MLRIFSFVLGQLYGEKQATDLPWDMSVPNIPDCNISLVASQWYGEKQATDHPWDMSVPNIKYSNTLKSKSRDVYKKFIKKLKNATENFH